MNPRQKMIVQTTWDLVIPISETAAELFYSRLFELDPDLKSLFKTEIKEQGKKLMQMITLVVKNLDGLPQMLPAIQNLGKRHADYGVKDEDYDTVGAALLDTLEKGLGDIFTPEVRDAWAKTYDLLATAMRYAAASE